MLLYNINTRQKIFSSGKLSIEIDSTSLTFLNSCGLRNSAIILLLLFVSLFLIDSFPFFSNILKLFKQFYCQIKEDELERTMTELEEYKNKLNNYDSSYYPSCKTKTLFH